MSSPILPVPSHARPSSGSLSPTPAATTEIGDVGAFIAQLGAGVSALTVQANRGGPPPEVLDQIAAAGEVAEQLRESGYRLRFFPAAPGERTRIELHDADGRLVRTLSTADAVEIAVGRPLGQGGC